VNEAREQRLRHVGSTYRLQLNGMGFKGARSTVPYLDDLGIETLYVSPITRARSGSTHGYDVIDPTVLDPALGTRADYDALLAELDAHGMRLLIDIVPNHMAASLENPYFVDVLRHGRRSRYTPMFDIAWEAADNAVILPMLDSSIAAAMDAGRVHIRRPLAGSGYVLTVDELRLPLDPGDDEDIAADLCDVMDLTDPAARRQLELLLSHQHYRLVDWRTAAHAVNYRRFFDINDLIGIRQEDPDVFELTHQLVLELAADQRLAGVRVDHIDGLRDPAHYLQMLRRALDQAAQGGERPVILVEKILERDEELPPWPVEGTTGYEFAADVTGLFIDPAGAEAIRLSCAAATGDSRTFTARATEAKRRGIDVLFAARLGHVCARMTRAVPRGAASRPNPAEMSVALQELSAQLEVYRTYRRPGERATSSDRRQLDHAAGSARNHLAGRELAALDQLVTILKGPTDPGGIAWEAVAAWQQFTPPVMAKGVEDTALYDPGTLLAAADVGSDPEHPWRSVSDWHERISARARRTPNLLNTLSTHDSKRSQDVRCRLAVLSELAEEWEDAIRQLEGRSQVAEPDVTDRRYAYETLVGAWPAAGAGGHEFTRRIQDHLVKAAREAKRRSSWLEPDEAYEERLVSFAADLLNDPTSRKILESVVRSVEAAGVTNSLSAIVLRAVAPGVPDVYQGDDSWFLALVDPDNRQPVPYDDHHASLRSLPDGEDVGGLLASWRDGKVKQAVLRASLRARRADRELFAEGDYLPLQASGASAAHVVSFARRVGGRSAVAVVPRLVHRLAGPARYALGAEIWQDTAVDVGELGQAVFVNVFTGRKTSVEAGTLRLADAFRQLPVALLVTDG
jgi:malto-oligosyltrehalose synthase